MAKEHADTACVSRTPHLSMASPGGVPGRNYLRGHIADSGCAPPKTALALEYCLKLWPQSLSYGYIVLKSKSRLPKWGISRSAREHAHANTRREATHRGRRTQAPRRRAIPGTGQIAAPAASRADRTTAANACKIPVLSQNPGRCSGMRRRGGFCRKSGFQFREQSDRERRHTVTAFRAPAPLYR